MKSTSIKLTSVSNIKNLLKKHNAMPSKRLGQNFLIDNSVIKKILKQTKLTVKDVVLEIGPGIGTLTQAIAPKVKKIIAIEKDAKIIKILQETTQDFQNIEIINEDILNLLKRGNDEQVARFYSSAQVSGKSLSTRLADNATRLIHAKPLKNNLLVNSNYKVVANLPFYITSPVIRKLLEIENKPKEIILIVQKEVAQRICASPPKTNLLAISVQFYAQPKIVSYVSKKSFFPIPKVDSAIIHLRPKKQNLKIDKNKFFKIVKAGFRHPRKQLINNLLKELEFPNKKLNREKIISLLAKQKILATQRPETLSLKNWIELTKVL
jgi:16S rRNA (adenine1518-N6/adenine1519-N6)-dimethyltransferase